MKVNTAQTVEWILANAKTQLVLNQDVDVEEMIQALEWALERLAAAEIDVTEAESLADAARGDAEERRQEAEALAHDLASLQDELKTIVADGQRPNGHTPGDILERVRLAIKESE